MARRSANPVSVVWVLQRAGASGATLLEEVLAYPGVPAKWARSDSDTPLVPVIPIAFVKDGRSFTFFSAITKLGTPQDVTLQELRIECFFPMDEETARNIEQMSS